MSRLKTLTVNLETVTPLFLGGAEPRGTPELRPPSFRGALRYWLRAALGGTTAVNLDQLKDQEGDVFGTTADDAHASRVVVRIANPGWSFRTFSQITSGRAGLAYLLFAARGTRHELERKALQGTFSVTMSTTAEHRMALDRACVALWLLLRLGGLGTRARRGAGTLRALDVNGMNPDLPSLPIGAKSSSQLVDELADGLRRIRSFLFGKSSSPRLSSASQFDTIHPDMCNIWVADKTYSCAEDALDQVGSLLQTFRSRRESDYSLVKQAIRSRQPLAGPVERAAFGLPIVFYYSSTRDRDTLQATDTERRASPLWVRPVRLVNGEFTVVFTWFRGVFLPADQQLHLKDTGASGPLPPDTLIRTFLTGMDPQPQKRKALRDAGINLIEVRYE
jgi:CRISPR-associated protein Cmr1